MEGTAVCRRSKEFALEMGHVQFHNYHIIKTGAVCFTWAAIKEFQNGTRTHEDWVRRMNEEVERLIKELTSPTPDRHRLRDLTPGEKIILSIIGINVAVWMLWKVPALQPRLWTYFVNSFSTSE